MSVVFKNKEVSPEVCFSPRTDKCNEKRGTILGISGFLGEKGIDFT